MDVTHFILRAGLGDINAKYIKTLWQRAFNDNLEMNNLLHSIM